VPVYKYAQETPRRRRKRVYAWGLAKAGALGKPNYFRQMRGKQRCINVVPKPARLEFGDENEVVDVACGFGFTVMAIKTKETRKVFGCGINTDSQIGYHYVKPGHPLGIIVNVVPIDIPFYQPATASVKQVACGRAHTVVLTSEGVFSLGNNAYGQCGRRVIEDESYGSGAKIHKILGIEEPVSKVVCGQDHTLFLSEQGKVYSCGWGADGQTGQGHFRSESEPRLVEGDIQGEKIVDLSCRADTVLALSDKGELFGWGNSEYGQLRSAVDEVQLNVSRHLKLNVGKIIHAAAAGSLCAVVNDSGLVYVWGFGVIGKGPVADQSPRPTQIPPTLFGWNEFNPQSRVVKVFAGMTQLAAITNTGDLYVWGHNNMSNLGLGHRDDQFFPFKVAVPAEVLKLEYGVDHTVALCRAFA